MAVPKVKRSEIFGNPGLPRLRGQGRAMDTARSTRSARSTRGRRLRANLRFRADRSAQ